MSARLRVLTGTITTVIWLGAAVFLTSTELWWLSIPVGGLGLLRGVSLVRTIRWLLDDDDDDE